MIKKCRAIALLELVMILPIIILISFLTIEISNLLRIRQNIILISQDMANNILKNCGELDDRALLRQCIANIQRMHLSQIRTRLAVSSQDMNIGILMLSRVHKFSNSCGLNGLSCPSETAIVEFNNVANDIGQNGYMMTGKVTQYGQLVINSTPRLRMLLRQSRALAITEIYFAQKTIIPFVLARQLGFNVVRNPNGLFLVTYEANVV